MSKSKYYAIRKGRKNNIVVNSWSECEELIKGYSSEYKAFTVEKDAYDWLNVNSNSLDEAEHIEIYNTIQERRQRDNGKRYSLEDVLKKAKNDNSLEEVAEQINNILEQNNMVIEFNIMGRIVLKNELTDEVFDI